MCGNKRRLQLLQTLSFEQHRLKYRGRPAATLPVSQIAKNQNSSLSSREGQGLTSLWSIQRDEFCYPACMRPLWASWAGRNARGLLRGLPPWALLVAPSLTRASISRKAAPDAWQGMGASLRTLWASQTKASASTMCPEQDRPAASRSLPFKLASKCIWDGAVVRVGEAAVSLEVIKAWITGMRSALEKR